MKISIVLPTYNRLDQLQHVLRGIELQTYPPAQFEVIIVSDGSTDGTDDYLRKLRAPFPLQALFQSNQGVAAARNHGIAHSTGEIVLFIDDDVYPTPNLIEEHLHYHQQHGDGVVVIGPMLAPPDFDLSPWVQWEADRLKEQYRAMTTGQWEPTARQFYTGNTSIARRHLIESGGFNPAYRRAEDVELAYRLDRCGLRFLFNPKAVGYHYAVRSFDGWLSIPYVYGRNDVIFSQQEDLDWLLPIVLKDYYQRNTLIRGLVSFSLSHPLLEKIVIKILRRTALLGKKTHLKKLSSFACSGLFNLRYYKGVADELGSIPAFFQALARAGEA